ncbi:MAG: sigma factor-like helix-turn-helix DNA-binding protein [Ferruginibacter sp.]
MEELSYREIAAILDTTESAVDSLLQRAKQNLRKKLTELPP